MIPRTTAAIGAALLLCLIEDTHAVEVLSAEELASHCEAFPDADSSADWEYCVRYIQGFIDGAVATDARVMLNIEAEYERKETFAERAFRTRVPDREQRRRAAEYAEFCLGDPVPLREVVTKVVDDLNERVNNMTAELTARNVVYASLRKHYPCTADGKD